jgi:hypothetical protein
MVVLLAETDSTLVAHSGQPAQYFTFVGTFNCSKKSLFLGVLILEFRLLHM